ncbi:hypothetical protein pdam_00009738, partial [Pocillopora damicornis]
MTEKLCEELAFPALFTEGRFGYTAEQQIKLSPVKLQHHSGQFATNPEYLFFAQFIIEEKKCLTAATLPLRKFMILSWYHHIII